MSDQEKIAYLGPEATFSHMAANSIFKKNENSKFVATETIEDVFEMVDNEECDYGVVPIENSNAGSVGITLDILCNEDYKIKIVGEYFQKINFHFLSNEENLDNIEVLYIHQMAHAQCRKWLRKNLPNVKIEKVSSNSLAAKLASENKNSGTISNQLSAEKYGLKVLFENIHDYDNNSTRFIVISKKEGINKENNKISILFSVKHEPGSLFGVLRALAERKLNMTKIESRIMKYGNWEYHFFVDVEGNMNEKIVEEALNEMQDHCLSFKVLGNYIKGQI